MPKSRSLYKTLPLNNTFTVMQNLPTVRLPDIEAQSLDTLCVATGRSRTEIVRDALRSYRLRETLRQS